MSNHLVSRTLLCAVLLASCSSKAPLADLTVIPPGAVSDKVDLDLRCGITNDTDTDQVYYVELSTKNQVFFSEKVEVNSDDVWSYKQVVPAGTLTGNIDLTLKVKGADGTFRKTEKIIVLPSKDRSIHCITGAWSGICHWSEIEGKHWNADIKKLTDDQWREMVRSMHKLGLDFIVIQEVFRNEEYVGKHNTTPENYQGKAYYPSSLYPGRMEITAKDPLEAIFSEADKLGMKVMPGVGLFAWFDFTRESLDWHKNVAQELWNIYGHHPSFYGFYVSEESGGSLDNWEWTEEKRQMRRDQIVDFMKEFKSFCRSLAPAKPIMLATNSFGVKGAEPTYERMLQYLDILCPFGFARMPEGDITGKEAADILQALCDKAGAHFWFDQEVFLFNEDNSLYPRDIEGIIKDLNLLDNFEKVLCYQYPGVFSDPSSKFRVGEPKTVKLFNDYQNYLKSLDNE